MQSLNEAKNTLIWGHLARLAFLKPNSGKLWIDLLNLFAIIWIQSTLFPSMSWRLINIDLITPWLVISFIRQKFGTSTFLCVVASLGLELRSTMPAGLYVCAYWMIANVIIQVRPTLSWRHKVPWAVTFLLAALWISFFETAALAISLDSFTANWHYWLDQLIRITSCVSVGMYLSKEWQRIDAEEPIPK